MRGNLDHREPSLLCVLTVVLAIPERVYPRSVGHQQVRRGLLEQLPGFISEAVAFVAQEP